MRGLLVALVGFCWLTTVGSPDGRPVYRSMLAAMLCLAVLRTGRMFWLFAKVVLVLSRVDDAADQSRLSWKRPVIGKADYARAPRGESR